MKFYFPNLVIKLRGLSFIQFKKIPENVYLICRNI